jgi:hypothetical protein
MNACGKSGLLVNKTSLGLMMIFGDLSYDNAPAR